MAPRPNHLHLVRTDGGMIAPAGPERGDLALMATLCALNLVPMVGGILHPGRWGAATVGAATACALVAGRELWLEARAAVRARRSGR